MTNDQTEFAQKLLEAQDISPALRTSYRDELDRMLAPELTSRRALPGIALLVVLMVCTAGIIRNLFVADPEPLLLVAWIVLAAACSWASILIVRDLWRRKHTKQAAFKIGHILMTAAATLTVCSLLIGLARPSDPASTFNAFFVFVFYFACTSLALDNRIAAAELAAREQMLRIECRLADLAELLRKAS